MVRLKGKPGRRPHLQTSIVERKLGLKRSVAGRSLRLRKNVVERKPTLSRGSGSTSSGIVPAQLKVGIKGGVYSNRETLSVQRYGQPFAVKKPKKRKAGSVHGLSNGQVVQTGEGLRLYLPR